MNVRVLISDLTQSAAESYTLYSQSDKHDRDVNVKMAIARAESTLWSSKLGLCRNVFSSRATVNSEGAVRTDVDRRSAKVDRPDSKANVGPTIKSYDFLSAVQFL